MNTTKIKSTIKGISLASAMVFGLVMFAGMSVNAQDRRGDGDRNDNYGNQQRDRNDNYRRDDRNRNIGREIKAAYDRGYQEGLNQGMRDARDRRGNDRNFGNNGMYGNNGAYSSNGGFWGNGGAYDIRVQQAYRQGFEKGYHDGLKKGKHNRRGGVRWPF